MTALLIIIAVLLLCIIILSIIVVSMSNKNKELSNKIGKEKAKIERILKSSTEHEFSIYEGGDYIFVYMVVEDKYPVLIKRFDDDDMDYNRGLARELVEYLESKI